MKFKNILLILVTLNLFSISSLFAESAGEHIDDATIASKTKTALIGEKTVKARNINVEVSKGVLQLSGFVDSETEESTALNIANGVAGVKEVLDAIVVSPGSRSAGEVLDDTSIAAKLKTKLTAETGLGDATAITTEVKRKHIILAGFVANESVRSKALEVASSINGVAKVHNLIAIKK
ncbi:MAG: BON domain-containing protein [Pseudomonadota bacterium]